MGIPQRTRGFGDLQQEVARGGITGGAGATASGLLLYLHPATVRHGAAGHGKAWRGHRPRMLSS